MAGKKTKRAKLRLSARLPADFYRREAVYWSGRTLELENFRRVVRIEPGLLCVETGRGYLTVTGQQLVVAALEKHRLLVKGRVEQIRASGFGTEEGKQR